jgi:hypothetical protein
MAGRAVLMLWVLKNGNFVQMICAGPMKLVPLSYRNAALSGSVKAIDCVTLLFYSNMSGTDKRKMLVIGKLTKPRCFMGINANKCVIDTRNLKKMANELGCGITTKIEENSYMHISSSPCVLHSLSSPSSVTFRKDVYYWHYIYVSTLLQCIFILENEFTDRYYASVFELCNVQSVSREHNND